MVAIYIFFFYFANRILKVCSFRTMNLKKWNSSADIMSKCESNFIVRTYPFFPLLNFTRMKWKNYYTPVTSFYYVTHWIVIGVEVAMYWKEKNLVIFPIMELQEHTSQTPRNNIDRTIGINNGKNIIAHHKKNGMLSNGFMIFRQKSGAIFCSCMPSPSYRIFT